jgi:hypothetical protein
LLFYNTPNSLSHCIPLIPVTVEAQPTTKVFAKAGLDNETSAMCRHQQRFGLDVKFSALVLNFIKTFSIGHLYRAGQSMNSLPSQIPGRYGQVINRIKQT